MQRWANMANLLHQKKYEMARIAGVRVTNRGSDLGL